MSLLARAPIRQLTSRRLATQARFVHGEYKHIPFEYSNKATFGAKVTVYFLSGFALPFVAAWYQLRKSSGGSD